MPTLKSCYMSVKPASCYQTHIERTNLSTKPFNLIDLDGNFTACCTLIIASFLDHTILINLHSNTTRVRIESEYFAYFNAQCSTCTCSVLLVFSRFDFMLDYVAKFHEDVKC